MIKDSQVTINKGAHPKPEITVTADTADILAVAEGKLDPTKALLMGKAKISGDMGEATKLMSLFM